jgi:hypothetical protein
LPDGAVTVGALADMQLAALGQLRYGLAQAEQIRVMRL